MKIEVGKYYIRNLHGYPVIRKLTIIEKEHVYLDLYSYDGDMFFDETYKLKLDLFCIYYSYHYELNDRLDMEEEVKEVFNG